MPASRRRGHVVIAPGFAFAAALLLATATAHGHEPFSITTEARALHDGLRLHVTMAGRTATLVCPDAAGAPHRLLPQDIDHFRKPLETCARGLYTITSGGHQLEPRSASISLTPEGDFDVRLVYPAPPPGPLVFDAVHLARLPDAMYGAELTVTGERVFLGQALLRAAAPTLTVKVPAAAAATPPSAPRMPTFGEYLRLGIEHILTGYDHLAFLLGLLVVCRKFTDMLAIVTSFTFAHSVTLALAVFGVVTLPSRVVEPLIAATIIAVAAENLWAKGDLYFRGPLAAAFGTIHGFGFAGALTARGLGKNGAPLALPLFAFNLGVELGQAGIALLVLPVLFRLRRARAFERYGATVISAALGILGLYWLVARIV